MQFNFGVSMLPMSQFVLSGAAPFDCDFAQFATTDGNVEGSDVCFIRQIFLNHNRP